MRDTGRRSRTTRGDRLNFLIGSLQHHNRAVPPHRCCVISGCPNQKLGGVCQISGTGIQPSPWPGLEDVKTAAGTASGTESTLWRMREAIQSHPFEHASKVRLLSAFLAAWSATRKQLGKTRLAESKHPRSACFSALNARNKQDM